MSSGSETKRVIKAIAQGHDLEALVARFPGIPKAKLEQIWGMSNRMSVASLTLKQSLKTNERDKKTISLCERNEQLAKAMEEILQVALDSFKPEDILALVPKERILLIANMTDKMRLLRGESTENIEAKGLIGHIIALNDADANN